SEFDVERLIPQRYAAVSFESSCITHDECYSTCGQAKGSCDAQMRNLLLAACQNYYVPLIAGFKRAGAVGSALSATISLQNCLNMSEEFFGAVSSRRGQEAYDTAQKDYCKCCQ